MFDASQSVPAYSDEFRTPFRFKADSVPIQAGHRSDWSRTVFRPKADGFRAPSEWCPSGFGMMSDLDRNGVRIESERCPNRAGNHVLGAPIRAGEASPLRGSDRRRGELWLERPRRRSPACPNLRRGGGLTDGAKHVAQEGSEKGSGNTGGILTPIGHPFIRGAQRRFAPITVRPNRNAGRYESESASDFIGRASSRLIRKTLKTQATKS